MIGFNNLTAPILLLLAFAGTSSAQTLGCSCNPSTYVWDVDLTKTCADTSFSNTGINERGVYCYMSNKATGEAISPAQFATNDITIARVDNVVLHELGATPETGSIVGRDLSQDGPFFQGAEVTQMSVVGETDPNRPFIPIVYGLKMTATGTTTTDEEVFLLVIIDFTNECDAEPIFNDGDTFGWLVFNEIKSGDIVPQYCNAPSSEPSMSSSPTVSHSPTVSPTAVSFEDCDDSESSEGEGGKGGKGGKGIKSSKCPKGSNSKKYKSGSSSSKSPKSKSGSSSFKYTIAPVPRSPTLTPVISSPTLAPAV